MHNPFLIGSTVYLRPLDLADAPTLTTWLNDPEVTKRLVRIRSKSYVGISDQSMSSADLANRLLGR